MDHAPALPRHDPLRVARVTAKGRTFLRALLDRAPTNDNVQEDTIDQTVQTAAA